MIDYKADEPNLPPLTISIFLFLKKKPKCEGMKTPNTVRWPLLFFNIHQHKDAIQRQPLLFWIQDQTKLSFHLTSFLLTQFRPKNIIPRGADAAGVLAGVPGAPAFRCWPAETLSVFSHVCISSRLAHPADTNCPLWLAWMTSDLQPLWDHLSPCYGCTVGKMLKHCDICYRSAESQEER